MHRALLWISPGDERENPQNRRDPVQLHQQVPGEKRIAAATSWFIALRWGGSTGALISGNSF